MRKSRFTEEQIIGVLREHEAGKQTADLCRKHGISPATFHQWKAKFGSLEVSEARRLRALEAEDAQLKKLLAEAMLNNAVLKDVASKMVMPAARRSAVTAMRGAHGISERWACSLLGADRIAVRYRSTGPDDGRLRAWLRSLASERRVFGYGRLGLLLARDLRPNHKKLRRLYREERLQVRRSGGRKRRSARGPMAVPDSPNQRCRRGWMPDEVALALRRQITRRNQIVRERVRLKTVTQSILHAHRPPQCPHADLFGKKGRATGAQLLRQATPGAPVQVIQERRVQRAPMVLWTAPEADRSRLPTARRAPIRHPSNGLGSPLISRVKISVE
jgi:putative transposase